MLTANSDTAWKIFGKTDPYYAVCTLDRFRAGHLDDEARRQFFRSGEMHIERVLKVIRESLDPGFQPVRALDFGCGVGRVTIPLARLCSEVVGVDVSSAMLTEAAENCRRQGIDNVNLVRSDNRLSEVSGRFDFIHSFIVFQHLPVWKGMRLARIMIDLLTENGMGALHFTHARRASRARKAVHWLRAHVPLANNLANVVQGRPWPKPMMQMNSYSVNALCEMLQASGCNPVHLRFTDHDGHLGIFVFFRKAGSAPGQQMLSNW